ncbi:uncharacterized protein JN550_006843 [Neoarthrinium moseri]|uniref:uncharacterized protein n=1 Tax=Neoarthrinium moseri TaxID=1658444 RepID=UPI001FDB6CF2|nr:uncharacterized protein JN550_006843 [Neoarthrinium moseri]KAI1867702.1 hypothetical protein JN550_006843 [Neoarthrinium moseri]
MASQHYFWGRFGSNEAFSQILPPVATLAVAYYIGRVIYNLYFHPLSKYPAPKLAAATDIWWAYARYASFLTIMYISAIVTLLNSRETNILIAVYFGVLPSIGLREGDIVRIAPNELVFLTPQAARDIYLSQEKNLELFVQVGYDALDTGDGGISGETNPVKHRGISKTFTPAFSTRNVLVLLWTGCIFLKE